ncbi:hypothetical protein TSOC_001294 [Tetrabaena socialis]|uniref:Uncharacterized protein n=1 Tax=Tetrabaena socialis TaxID=47790 RepID=A0A2J8AH13_9CHLO|nr:hypothetical protein TSOC_001294 [Tetrabaena socialis]|eukprot:PNH11800.1 hypothetical protein TSOC_001294 [Tetrabaena socialis]
MTTSACGVPRIALVLPAAAEEDGVQGGKRARKGESDGAWREDEVHRWQLAWRALFPWAEPVHADEGAGETHDRVRCSSCSERRGVDVLLDARKATLQSHASSSGHAKSQQLTKDQEVELGAAAANLRRFKGLYDACNSEADKKHTKPLSR